MESIGIDSWSRPENALRTLCITQAELSIGWHLEHCYGVTQPEYQRLGSMGDGHHSFDVYEAAIPGGRREFWMNVSYWHGRGILLEPSRQNVPPPGQSMTVLEFLGESQLRNLPFPDSFMEPLRNRLGEIRLDFAHYASRQLSNTVAVAVVEDDVPTVRTAPVREFITESLPLFHGFSFVKPFLMHQVMHLLCREQGDHASVEVKPRANCLPVPGLDCVPFTPAVVETPASDFWNYMLWAHRPGAFESEVERALLEVSARTAMASKFVGCQELVDALELLDVKDGDGEALRALTRTWLIPTAVVH